MFYLEKLPPHDFIVFPCRKEENLFLILHVLIAVPGHIGGEKTCKDGPKDCWPMVKPFSPSSFEVCHVL